MFQVKDSGCSAYRSFVNLDPVLPVGRWPEPGVEIQWVAPRDPVCGKQSDCDGESVCGSDPVQNGMRRWLERERERERERENLFQIGTEREVRLSDARGQYSQFY